MIKIKHFQQSSSPWLHKFYLDSPGWSDPHESCGELWTMRWLTYSWPFSMANCGQLPEPNSAIHLGPRTEMSVDPWSASDDAWKSMNINENPSDIVKKSMKFHEHPPIHPKPCAWTFRHQDGPSWRWKTGREPAERNWWFFVMEKPGVLDGFYMVLLVLVVSLSGFKLVFNGLGHWKLLLHGVNDVAREW